MSQAYLPTTLSSNPNLPSSFPISQNTPSTLPPSSLPPPPTSYDPNASLHPGFHNYPPPSFQPPTLPPNPLLPSTSTYSFNLSLPIPSQKLSTRFRRNFLQLFYTILESYMCNGIKIF